MVLLFVLPIAFALAILFEKKFEDTVALSIFVITSVLYISGLVSSFIPGMYIVYFIAAFSIVYCIYRCFFAHNVIISDLACYGFWGFC